MWKEAGTCLTRALNTKRVVQSLAEQEETTFAHRLIPIRMLKVYIDKMREAGQGT